MRLIVEAAGRTFVISLDRNTPPEPEQQGGDMFATTERANAFDFDDRPPIRLGFAGKRTT